MYEIWYGYIKPPIGKNKRVIGLMKDELDGKIITKYVGPRAKNYSYFKDDGITDKKVTGTIRCVIN